MRTPGKATFTVKTWSEKPYFETADGGRFTRATVTKSITGDVTGEATCEYLMVYRAGGSASFVGLEHVNGSVGGRGGTFVLQHQGTAEDGIVTTTWFVVPGSGTAQLRGLVGEGGYTSGHQEKYPMTLDYAFE
jgi:hypothetical protein